MRAPEDGDIASGEHGFTIIMVLIAIAVTSILLATVATTWTRVTRREAEEEMIWRARQYVRGIRCYMQARGGPPTELEGLVEAGCIRRLWTQPLSEDGAWEVLRVEAPGLAAPSGDEGRGGLRSADLRSSQPIVGVAPGLEGRGFHEIDGSDRYEDWEFVLGGPDEGTRLRALGLPEGFRPGLPGGPPGQGGGDGGVESLLREAMRDRR